MHCCSGSGDPADAAEEIAAALTAVSPKGRALAASVFAEAVSLFSAWFLVRRRRQRRLATSAARALSPSGPVAKALAKCASDADPAVRAGCRGSPGRARQGRGRRSEGQGGARQARLELDARCEDEGKGRSGGGDGGDDGAADEAAFCCCSPPQRCCCCCSVARC